MASHSERILSAILDKENPRRDLLAIAVLRLQADHFPVEIHKNIFRLLVRYYDTTGEIMPQEVFNEAIQGSDVDSAKAVAYINTFESLLATHVDEAQFKWSVDELRSEQAKHLTGTAIASAMEILERGYEDKKGNYFKGHEEARSYLAAQLHAIERLSSPEIAPEGNIFVESQDIWATYLATKEAGPQGVKTGIRYIDDATGGFYPGELILIVAYAGVGKSMLGTQMAWDVAVNQKKNVFFATKETLRDQVIRRILARHSRLPQFKHPINSADLKRGTLSTEDEAIFKAVLDDWQNNPEYGELNIVQIPGGNATMGYVENRLKEYGRDKKVDVAVVDYLALLKSETKRTNEREEFNEILRDARGVVPVVFDGTGVPLVSPWQVSRDAYDHALRNGYYTRKSLADTSEAEKSSDQILGIIREEENNSEINLQFIKMRDDGVPPTTSLSIDLRSTYIGTHTNNVAVSNVAGTEQMLANLEA